MSVFRIEKTRSFLFIHNHHLHNAELSLKAKGLMSQLISNPEDWDYTLSGLSKINRDSKASIKSAIYELERAGYIYRTRERNKNGQYGQAIYTVIKKPLETTDSATIHQTNPPPYRR